MKTLKFYGSSDDLFELDGDLQEEQDNCANGKTMAYGLFSGGFGQLIVTAQYAPECLLDGVWTIGVALWAEGRKLPGWDMRFENGEETHSPMLVIEAPDDVTVKCFGTEARNADNTWL